MRKRIFIFALLFTAVSVGGMKATAASTDCDKWLQQYRDELANAAPVQHVRHHVHRFLHRPRPVQVAAIPPIHRTVPRLTPAEMLRRFHILCDTPDEIATLPAPAPSLLPVPAAPAAPVELASVAPPPLPFTPPSVSGVGTPVGGSPLLPPTAPGAPVLPITPSTPSSPTGPGTPTPPIAPPGTPGGPGTPTPPIAPPTPTPPVVPEPSSIVLLLTGMTGIAMRRFRRS